MITERIGALIRTEIRKKTDTFPAKASEFTREIEDCIEYFESKSADFKKKRKHPKGFSVHGGRIEVGRINGEKPKLYFARDVLYADTKGGPPYRETITVENNNLIRSKVSYPDGISLGQEFVNNGDLRVIIDKIHGITLPYAVHAAAREVKQ